MMRLSYLERQVWKLRIRFALRPLLRELLTSLSIVRP